MAELNTLQQQELDGKPAISLTPDVNGTGSGSLLAPAQLHL